jgi:NAD(P)-dependent dehydrogenase (short-subunit alcohol dehydrogenase family)
MDGQLVKDKVAIVTGGGRGIGRAIALELTREGAAVVVVDIGVALDGSGGDSRPAEEVVGEIKAGGGRAIASTLSIADAQSAQAIVEAALAAFGRVDILINNAGILRDRMFHKMSHVDWAEVLQVNLTGAFNMARAVAGHFREQESGAMVHMTSTSGLVGNFGQANYMASKLGLHGLSRGIALDLARFNVRSNCIAPFAWSRMTSSIPVQTEAEEERIARVRQMTPDKNAPLAVFLVSDKAVAISGQIFAVRNNEIMLFNQPRPVRSIHRGNGWTPATIAEQLPAAFKRSLTPLERSGDVFDWDPI